MLAVIKMGGKQYRVAPEQILYTELTGEEAGKELDIKEVLLVQNGSDVKVGAPFVEGASVKAKIISDEKGPKLNAFKYKRRKNYHRRWGHRQKYQKLQIVSINA